MEPLIKAKNLNFTYNQGKDNEYQSLINISFEIFPEEFIIIFGPSGCGKSTLLNLIAGLERPELGCMYLFNKDLAGMTKNDFAAYHRAQLGMVFQQYNLITSLSVLDNVALPQIFVSAKKRDREKLAKSMLERFGILKQAKKIPTELSGGQQQRIGIARAIINNPKIVLADEPVGNLDSVSAKNVLDILAELNEKEKKTIILVTHNPENLVYGDRIFYMKDGIITREVVNRDKHNKDKKDFTPKSATAEINDLMRAYHGLTPEQINILIMPYKAKAFAHHFIASRNMEETKILEDIIQRRLLGTIPQEEFFDILKKNSLDSGVGFDVRTAEKMLRRVNRIIRTAYYIYQDEHQQKSGAGHEKISDDEKAKKVTWYLLGSCYYEHYKNLDDVQVNRLQQAVKDRLTGVIQKADFYKTLDQAFKDGGVGLNSKTAKAMTEELELILILGFGIVQRTTIEAVAEERRAAAPEAAAAAPATSIEEIIARQATSPALSKAEGAALGTGTEAAAALAASAAQALAPGPAADEPAEREKMYLSAEEASDLAKSGLAFEPPTDPAEALLKSAINSNTLKKEIEEAERLAVESEKALNNITPETEKMLREMGGGDGPEETEKP